MAASLILLFRGSDWSKSVQGTKEVRSVVPFGKRAIKGLVNKISSGC